VTVFFIPPATGTYCTPPISEVTMPPPIGSLGVEGDEISRRVAGEDQTGFPATLLEGINIEPRVPPVALYA
jgi:hypothetical protein